MSYLFLKHLHMSLVLGSLLLLWGRFISSAYFASAHKKWMTALAHTVDLSLISAGVAMVILFHIPLFAGHWLVAKLVGLCCYIACGIFALRTPNANYRWVWLALAMLSLAYVVGVALTKSPVLALAS